jgi:hypothetical protein
MVRTRFRDCQAGGAVESLESHRPGRADNLPRDCRDWEKQRFRGSMRGGKALESWPQARHSDPLSP